MFYLGKLLAFATQPVAWAMLLLGLALISFLFLPRRRKLGLGLCWSALIALFIGGWQPLPEAFLRSLEFQYPNPHPNAPREGFVGMVVLGGALASAHLWTRDGQIALNEAGERMIVPVGLLKQHPNWKMLFTGGVGELFGEKFSEAERAKIFFDNLGVPAEQVLYESKSRTTYENAAFSAKLGGVNIKDRWLLVTSASHMPRSMATFRQAGWNVTPYAVDFRTSQHDIGWTEFSFTAGTTKWHLALHEWLGLWVYRWTGRA